MNINEYIQSEGYLERKASFEAIFGNEENNFSVTRVIELSADNLRSGQAVHSQNKENSVEQQIGVLLHSILNSDDYDGGIILTDSETRTELSESEIAKINQALKQ